MGGLAALAREAGHKVTGCDAGVYPPMSDQLRSLLPDALAIVFTGVGRRNGTDCSEKRVDALEFSAAFGAVAEVIGDRLALSGFAIVISNQLFLFRMFHGSVPIAFARPRCSTKGSNALRSFCTERKTVFFAALVLDFRTSAISSIPEPPQ